MIIAPNFKINGRYEVKRELGRGTFGVAYLACDTHMHSHQVVVKLLTEANVREIEALTLISHPNVVRVYEQGWTPEGSHFFVMQYVEGKRLADVIPERGMDLGRAARIVSQLGSALTAVHDAGVVHRDLKPANVMLQTSRDDVFAILIDFGGATVEDPLASVRGQETRAGTPFYMAPEQLRGRPVAASDVWALGVVAYEMVTGRRPFSPADVLALKDTPRAPADPMSLRPELPEAARDVILKALNYDPTLRYTHACEMGELFLRAVRDPAPPPPPPAPAPESHKELLRRCQELFESFDEFRSPDSLHGFFSVAELRAYQNCVGRGVRLEFDQLLDCLCRSGREYRGQALIALLAVLASRYRDDYRGWECEGLRASLKQLLARPPAAERQR
jgi:serine/threonine protein kinase